MAGPLDTCPSMTIPDAEILVLDFTARWCGPCKLMAPVLARLAEEYRGRARIVEVDVDEERDLATRYDVRSMPTLVVLRSGTEVGRIVGSRPRAFVAGVLDRALAGEITIAGP